MTKETFNIEEIRKRAKEAKETKDDGRFIEIAAFILDEDIPDLIDSHEELLKRISSLYSVIEAVNAVVEPMVPMLKIALDTK